MSRQAERILTMTYYANSARQPAHYSVAALQLSREYLMKINTPDEHHLALLRIEQLFDVDDPKSNEGKELLKLLEAVEEYEEDQELISIVRERINQPEILTKLDDL
ncbi:hypothetical protein ACPV4X_20625 [Vibrio owensii]|uniref:hypothetical protein n=1 Tax=Vibrio owensii TaxID=696485 RepID=UPI004067CF9E